MVVLDLPAEVDIQTVAAVVQDNLLVVGRVVVVRP